MPQPQHICMLAAENDAIPGAKVGGIGDVLRDIPKALAHAGAHVSVIIPAYDAFHTLPGAGYVSTIHVRFAGTLIAVEVHELYQGRDAGIRYLVLHHPQFGACGAGHVYCDDPDHRPFATDASKFALFCAAALQTVTDDIIGHVDVLHLHDWHAGFAAVLREFDPYFTALKSTRCVFSIHNLAMQGIRPFNDDASSLEQWYPELNYDAATIADPRWPNCVNPIAAAIRLCDVVHTVSPSYSLEVLQANDADKGFHGGEGLQADLQQRADNQALVGIINGIDYDHVPEDKMPWHAMMSLIGETMLAWLGESRTISTADYVAHQRTQQWLSSTRPQHMLTSVGRLTEQKMSLLLANTQQGTTVLDELLISLQGRGVFILLGSGDEHLEAVCRKCASKHPNFLFLNRYAQRLADLLFVNGDVFLMPSSFEPCGISQMLAMRHAQPCIVHAVGGLRDTVIDNQDGFHFGGDSLALQADQFLQRVADVLELREKNPEQFRVIASKAGDKRFYWASSAKQYINELYTS